MGQDGLRDDGECLQTKVFQLFALDPSVVNSDDFMKDLDMHSSALANVFLHSSVT